jgi:hypothetical protein
MALPGGRNIMVANKDVRRRGNAAQVVVAALPSASAVGVGALAFVVDATATTFASTVAGGGSNKVPVYSDGTNWKIG